MAEQIPLPLSFNPELGFAQFYSGPNAELVDHLERTAAGQGEPLVFLWGPPGAGKTHLLNACCAMASPSRSASYLPLNLLYSHGPALLEGLEAHDLVCIDDLDRIASKLDWETALFELFNRLRETGRDLVVTASAPPSQVDFQLADLKSRFSWGLTLRLLPLDDASKLKVLELKARALGLELPPPVARFLVARCQRDLTTLAALLERLDRASLAAQRKLTLPFVRSLFGEGLLLVQPEKSSRHSNRESSIP